jgi:hypothetical protein
MLYYSPRSLPSQHARPKRRPKRSICSAPHILLSKRESVSHWSHKKRAKLCIASPKAAVNPKIFPGGFSTHKVFPLPRFSTSAETHPGTKNAKHLFPTREKPKMAHLDKKRKIPGEAMYVNADRATWCTRGAINRPLRSIAGFGCQSDRSATNGRPGSR